MPPARLSLKEEDVVRLALEFLDNRELHISQISLERETGVINGKYSDDVLFLRQLILDGQWDDVIEFIQPLEALQTFDIKNFCYTILKHKYIELLCIKSEAGGSVTAAGQGINSMNGAVEEIVQILGQLEKLAPSKEEYSNLCLLLTLPRLADHLQFRDWNPSKARVQCFRQVFPLVQTFLPSETKLPNNLSSKNDRLMQLVIKGALYESCVSYCQAKATGSLGTIIKDIESSKLLDGSVGFSDSDLSLLSWLQSIPEETFAVPFEQKTLNVDIERLDKPTLETSWTEHMLVTPIKPKTFPHSVIPFNRPRSATDIMTRSLLPNLDGLPFGINNTIKTNDIGGKNMSKSSFASFHLTGIRPLTRSVMVSSVDRLFTNDTSSSQNYNTNNSVIIDKVLPSIQEYTNNLNTISNLTLESQQTTNINDKENLSISSTARSSRRDSLSDKYITQEVNNLPTNIKNEDQLGAVMASKDSLFSQRMRGELLDNYQKQKIYKESLINTNQNEKLSIDMTSNDMISDINSIKTNDSNNKPHFVPITRLEDVQAVRCVEFHPNGTVYGVGSNSKTFRICEYPLLTDIKDNHNVYQPTVLFKRTKHHKGSIYCMGWSPDGQLIATGSNDKTIKLMKYNEINKQIDGQEIELTMHDGTVRDICFLEDTTNKSHLLISGGAGDCKIYITDCETGTPYQKMSGHNGHILSIYNWGSAIFVSGSLDKTIKFWDLRTKGCVNTIITSTISDTRYGSPVASVCVDPSGRLLVSGHEDSSCVLYDIRGNRSIQCFKPHTSDVRSVRFSPSAYYLLTAGYDNRLVLTDLQGDLTLPLPSVVVAQHSDKVISGRWHPNDFSFLSTSADKTATLWALPPL